MDTKKSDDIDDIAAPQVYPGEQPPPYSGPELDPSNPSYADYSQKSHLQVTGIHSKSTKEFHGSKEEIPIPAVIITDNLGPSPTLYVCPSCNEEIETRVKRKPSGKTHLLSALLCLIGGVVCACIPYCVDSCNNTAHYCPNCKTRIGTFIR